MMLFRPCVLCALNMGSCNTCTHLEATLSTSTSVRPKVLFDDFSYSNVGDMISNGWVIRSGKGSTGVAGATFRPQNVSFLDYTDRPDNRVLRMTASTDGTNENTYQTQIRHQRKFLDGTYAARVRFSDEPVSGPDGDHIVETFYAIYPSVTPMDPDYSEIDNEYLPNSGWGGPAPMFYVTTWETVQLEPWITDNASTSIHGSLAGWHTLVMQVAGGTVRYFIDGTLIAEHAGKYYPEVPMSINFNLWFDAISPGMRGVREYQEDIDWVFHEVGVSLRPEDVDVRVAELRMASIRFTDTVPF